MGRTHSFIRYPFVDRPTVQESYQRMAERTGERAARIRLFVDHLIGYIGNVSVMSYKVVEEGKG